jgi:peptidoglycan/xylan/chitin deacetylase (PgdA/CDA1 family)
MEVMARHGVRGTVALNSEVCDDYPQIIEDAVELGWEFMGHNQSNSRYLHLMSPDEERGVVRGTFERIEKATSIRPKGWLSSGLQESWHTLDYLVEAGATYVADWVNDDQPYVMNVGGKRLCAIPYSTEINDLPPDHPRRPVVG